MHVAVERLLVVSLDERLEATNYLVTMVEVSVDQSCRVDGEEGTIEECVGCREVQGRVRLIRSLIEETILVDNLRHLVAVTKAIVWLVDVDRDVGGVPSVGEPDGDNDRESDEHAHKVVDRGEEWRNQRRSGRNDHVPIESGDRVEAQTRLRASDGIQFEIVRGNPGHPGEVREEGGNVVGEPEVDEHACERIKEESELGDLPSVGNRVNLGVERVVQCNSGKIARPDSSRGVHKEPARKTGETIPNELERKRECDWKGWLKWTRKSW